MRLLDELKKCGTEEAVKAVFIKYGGFPAYIRDKVDLFVKAVLFEFKYDVRNMRTNYGTVLAQAVVYLKRIREGIINLPIPEAIALVDINAALIFKVDDRLIDACSGTFKWDKPASQPDKKLVAYLQNLPLEPVKFDITTEQGLTEFLNTIHSINEGTEMSRRVVSALNFEEVFASWKELFGECFKEKKNLGSYFIADLLEDTVWDPKRGVLHFPMFENMRAEIPVKVYEDFWRSYARPPAAEVQSFIMARAHIFVPETTRRMTGAFFTPPAVALKAYEYLEKALGPKWQEEYWVWDNSCGTGNLVVPHKYPERVFMSTLDMNEVLMLKQGNYFPGAEIFRFDFLNDSYSALPERLRQILEDPEQKILILMNPPYGEATAHARGGGANKTGASFTTIGEEMIVNGFGAAKNELFNQFIYRSRKIAPRAALGVFATLKYITAPQSQSIRDRLFGDMEAKSSMMFPGKVFPGVNGKFPVSFVVWDNGENRHVTLDILDDNLSLIGEKHYEIDASDHLPSWFKRPANTELSIPVQGCFAVKKGYIRSDKLAKNALGWVELRGNDLQNQALNFLMSAVLHNGHGSGITPELFTKCMVSVAVKVLPKATWTNDRDQFTVPFCDREPGPVPETNLPVEFIDDCVVYELFHGSNRTAAFRAEYKGEEHIIVNEFYPFTREEAKGMIKTNLSLHRAVDRFNRETFVADWLGGRTLSDEAIAVLEAGKKVYEKYYRELPNLHRQKYKLEFWNPGWYQIRMSLKDHHDGTFLELEELMKVHRALRAKLLPQVYGLGFLEEERGANNSGGEE